MQVKSISTFIKLPFVIKIFGLYIWSGRLRQGLLYNKIGLTLFVLGNFSRFCGHLLTFFKLTFSKNSLRNILFISECHTGPTWVQTVKFAASMEQINEINFASKEQINEPSLTQKT